MLCLLFRIDEDRYALDASHIVEVIPLLNLSRVPQAPRGFAGLINYRGEPVPALDLSELLAGRPAVRRLSTRLVVVRCPQARGQVRLLALIAENATEIIRKNANEFVTTGVKIRSAPYLGPVLLDGGGSIQLIRHDLLVSEGAAGLLPETAVKP